MGLPRWFSGKELSSQSRKCSLTLALVRSPGEGNGNLFQYLAWKTPWTEESR